MRVLYIYIHANKLGKRSKIHKRRYTSGELPEEYEKKRTVGNFLKQKERGEYDTYMDEIRINL
jgi:hypothetical protein